MCRLGTAATSKPRAQSDASLRRRRPQPLPPTSCRSSIRFKPRHHNPRRHCHRAQRPRSEHSQSRALASVDGDEPAEAVGRGLLGGTGELADCLVNSAVHEDDCVVFRRHCRCRGAVCACQPTATISTGRCPGSLQTSGSQTTPCNARARLDPSTLGGPSVEPLAAARSNRCVTSTRAAVAPDD